MFAEPFEIRGVIIPNRVVLGPMAGVTCRPFRQHMKSHGVGLVHTEMVSAYGIIYKNSRTLDFLRFAEEERPLAVQLFGGDPEVMERAASLVVEAEPRPDLIDINMGCPVRKVTKTGAGAALLADPQRALAVAAAVVCATAPARLPVTVKLRTGIVPGDGVAEWLAPRLEDLGVAAISLHARAAAQLYQGQADHAVSARVVRSVSVPVIASGDVNSTSSAVAIMQQSGCAAVMVARGVLGFPWLVGKLLAAQSSGGAHTDASPSPPVVIADLLELFARARDDMGERRAVRWIRSHIGWYLRRLRVPSARIQELRLLDSAESLIKELRLLALTLEENAAYNPSLAQGSASSCSVFVHPNGGIQP